MAVSEVPASAEDETAYLLESPANRERLLRAIENIAEGRDLVAVDLDALRPPRAQEAASLPGKVPLPHGAARPSAVTPSSTSGRGGFK